MADTAAQLTPSKRKREDESGRLSTEAIRVIAQSVPNMPPLAEPAAAALAPDAEYRLREIIQDSVKFMKHSKRAKLMPSDINAALRLRNVEPIYGFGSNRASKGSLPVAAADTNATSLMPAPEAAAAEPSSAEDEDQTVFTQVAGVPDLFFLEDSEISVKALLQQPLPHLPLEVTVSAHWLVVDGSQPAIAQNPAKKTSRLSQLEDPASGSEKQVVENGKVDTEVKPIIRHDLSRELQLYLDQLTEAILGDSVPRIRAVVDSVAQEPGIVQLLPYFTRFISNAVTKYIRNLPILYALMRLVNAILDNDVFRVENYLHQLLPAVMTCLVGKRLSAHPRENHWALRDYAARIVQRICAKYGASYATLQPKITKTLVDAISNVKRPLTTHYGAILGTAVLGQQVVDSLLMPRLGSYATKIRKLLHDPNQKPARRFEASKVFGAMAWAVSLTADQLNGLEQNHAISSLSGQNGINQPVEISKQRFFEVLPNSGDLFDTLKREMGERMYPYGGQQSEDELEKAMLKSQIVAK